MDNLECSNRMLVPELDLIIARSWNRQNDVTVTLNIARKKWNFWKERSLRVQTSCKDLRNVIYKIVFQDLARKLPVLKNVLKNLLKI